MSQSTGYSARAWNVLNLVINVSIRVDPCFRDDNAFLFQSFLFVDRKFPLTRVVNSAQVHFFPSIISFSWTHAKVLVSLPTILDSMAWRPANPVRGAEFLSCHMQIQVHHSSNFLPLEPLYIPGSANIFDNLGAWKAAPSELDAAGLPRVRARLWLTAFNSPVSWLPSDSSWRFLVLAMSNWSLLTSK